jgi:hypothetical protein
VSDIFTTERYSPAVCQKMLENRINKQDFVIVVKTVAGMSEKDFAVITGKHVKYSVMKSLHKNG